MLFFSIGKLGEPRPPVKVFVKYLTFLVHEHLSHNQRSHFETVAKASISKRTTGGIFHLQHFTQQLPALLVKKFLNCSSSLSAFSE